MLHLTAMKSLFSLFVKSILNRGWLKPSIHCNNVWKWCEKNTRTNTKRTLSVIRYVHWRDFGVIKWFKLIHHRHHHLHHRHSAPHQLSGSVSWLWSNLQLIAIKKRRKWAWIFVAKIERSRQAATNEIRKKRETRWSSTQPAQRSPFKMRTRNISYIILIFVQYRLICRSIGIPWSKTTSVHV